MTMHDPLTVLSEAISIVGLADRYDHSDLAAELLAHLAERGWVLDRTEDAIAAAHWCVDQLGYPFDMHTDVPVPEPLRQRIVATWIARDGDGTLETARFIARTCAEEGGWS